MDLKGTIIGLCAAGTFGTCPPAPGANPILPLDEFIPDVEARVFTSPRGEQRLYLYGSHDNYPTNSWCSWQYRVYSAPLDNLEKWTDHGVSFASKKGEGYLQNGKDADGVSWSDKRLYAPDVFRFDDKYWLVSCLESGGLGMSSSDTPEGPFSPAVQIVYDDDGSPLPSIDPALYAEGDTLYLIWGQKHGWGEGLVGTVLKKNSNGMYSVASKKAKSYLFGTRDNPDRGFGFYEGPSIRKINGTYYILYPSNKGKGVHMMSYATASQPLGPYTFRGNILDSDGIDREGGNNHGSLCEVNGRWYIFYHRGFNGNMSRKVSVEPITIHPDGTIDPIVMTNHGFGGPLNPFEKIEAAYATHVRLDGFKSTCHLDEAGKDLHPLVAIKDGNCIEYKNFDFGDGEQPMVFTAAIQPKAGGSIELVLDNPHAGTIGILTVLPSGKAEWTEATANIQPVKGVHTLFLRFLSNHDSDICNLASFRFSRPSH